jgi:molybdate transport system substrate-binding protein
VVSEESNVRLVRAKVELGEADAAIVFRTDARASGRVRAVPFPPDFDVRSDYSIGIVAGSSELELARAWVEFVLGPEGRAALTRRGFEVAP